MGYEMKNDLIKLKELLDSFGVEYDADNDSGGHYVQCGPGGEKVDGYLGFYTFFRFDGEGKFIEMGVDE